MKKPTTKVAKKKPVAKKIAKKAKIVVKKSGPKKVVQKIVPKFEYEMSLRFADVKFESKGKDFNECVASIKKDANIVFKSKAELVFSSGEKKSHMMMKPFQVRKFLVDSLVQQVIAKRMMSTLK